MNIDFQQLRVPTALALRWRALADRKINHLADLRKSGRWNCYYSEEQLAAAVKDAERAREQWDNFAQRELARANLVPKALPVRPGNRISVL
jgi:uncharacterized repeat protein (TIGR03809 family)